MTEREIFLAILDLPDPAARAAFLDEACGGDRFRRARLESLLRAHDTAAGFLDCPAVSGGELDVAAIAAFRAAADDLLSADALAFLTPSDHPESLGRIGHYEVLEVLGQGGFGIVLRAFDAMLQRVVAVKVLAPQLAVTSAARKRFLREARSSAQVRHENIVQVHAVGEQPLPYLVMECIPGETLQRRLERTGPLATAEVIHLGRQIAAGLAAAHAMGLIHRDIKPGNILIETGPQQRVKLTDFGLARAADDASETESGHVAGTPMFMAPEQARGEALDHRADLFSLGSVLYTMCSGRPPFRASGTLAVLKRVAEDTPRPIPEILPEVPAWLCDLIARLHAKKPEDRFGSAHEVAELLARYQANPHACERQRLPRRGSSAWKALPWIARRRRFGVMALSLVLVLLVGLGVTEATGVTHVHGTVIRLFSPQGTLVVELDDPGMRVAIDGEDMVITGAGVQEIRLKPGQHRVEASKDGKLVRQELVTIARNGRQVVRVSREAVAEASARARSSSPRQDATAWEQSVALLPAQEQVNAVVARLRSLNPGFQGTITPTLEQGVVTGLEFSTEAVSDIAPVRALPHLVSLLCTCSHGKGILEDLSPLQDMKLQKLDCTGNPISDLSPLRRLPLTTLVCRVTQVSDLSPLAGMRLTTLECGCSGVASLAPLQGMPLTRLVLDHSPVCDLSPLRGMPLTYLHCGGSEEIADLSPLQGMPLTHFYCNGARVTDLSPLRGAPLKEIAVEHQLTRHTAVLRSLRTLAVINYKPAADFWKDVGQE